MTLMLTIDDYLKGQSSNFLKDFFIDLLMIIPFISLMGLVVSKFLEVMDRYFNWKNHFFDRILVSIFFTSLVSLGAVSIYFLLVEFFHLNLVDSEWTDAKPIAFAIFVIIFLIVSMVMIFREFMNSLRTQEALSMQSEVLRRKNVEFEYQMLKNQISPHFLFNNLSVLSSLVYKSPEKSDEFIKEFSQIFRYILELNNETVVQVSKEIYFLESYMYLLTIRFGDCIEFVQNIDEDKVNHLIPPLSTQFLIENAIKHNQVNVNHHLKVEIFNELDYLIVRNNLMPRNDAVPSTGKGLKNLTDKYHIISDRLPDFQAVEGYYLAKIPLIAPENA